MKVEIDAGGRKVVLEGPDTNTTYRELADQALTTWRATEDGKTQPIGFAAPEVVVR